MQITKQLLRQTYSEHCQTFCKSNDAWVQVHNQKFFRAGEWGGGIVFELGHFDKYFVKKTRKRGHAEKHFGVFFLDILKTTFWMENLILGKIQSGPFLSNIRTPFSIFKKGRGGFPSSPLVAHLRVWLNMPKYPWKCLNKLLWLFPGSEYAWSSYILDRLLKMPIGF